MAGFSIIILGILAIVFLIGIGTSITGLVLLIIYIVKKKKSIVRKVLLILGIIFLVVGIVIASIPPTLLKIGNNLAVDSHYNPKLYPISNAIAHHNNGKLKSLLKSGLNPNEVCDDPAIFTACNSTYANSIAVQLLIDYNVNINAVREDNGFGDIYLASNTLMKYIFSNIISGTESELYKIIKILLQNGYDANQTDSGGASVLMYATSISYYKVSNGDFDLALNAVKLLIEHKANVNSKDNYGRTVLMWACGSHNPNVDAFNQEKQLPKDITAKYGCSAPFDYNLIKYLIESGADIHAKDNFGNTALEYFKQAEENAKGWATDPTMDMKAYKEECIKIEAILK